MSIKTNITFWKAKKFKSFYGSARPVKTGWAIPFSLILKPVNNQTII
jgi:hypothetical protein